MRAKNLPAGLPNYKTTVSGDTVFDDGTIRKAKETPVNVEKKEITEEKFGRNFTVYQGKKGYTGVYYGKLNVLMANMRTTYGNYGSGVGTVNGMSYRTTADYFLQKRGENAIYNMTSKNLVTLTTDNPLANRKAKAARVYQKLFVGSMITGVASIGSAIFLGEKAANVAAGAFLISFPTALITMPIAVSKQRKALKIYNK